MNKHEQLDKRHKMPRLFKAQVQKTVAGMTPADLMGLVMGFSAIIISC